MGKLKERIRKEFSVCSSKHCNNIPVWFHSGLEICICEECYNKIDFRKNFVWVGYNL